MSKPLQLNDLPPELLGNIFWHLTVPDILRLKRVNRTFHDVVSDQPHLQYMCELVAAGLVDNPGVPGTVFDRRTSLHKYRSRFDGLKPMSKSSLPLEVAGSRRDYGSSGAVYAISSESTNTLHFCRPPLASWSRPMKTWSFSLPFEPGRFVIHSPLDLVVITDNTTPRLHLRSMTTGDPHPLAANQCIGHDELTYFLILYMPICIDDHMLAASIGFRLVLWNWRTGAKVFDRDDLYGGSMAFIGNDRLLFVEEVGGPYPGAGVPSLVLLDTSTLTDSPAVPRRVRFVWDPQYCDMQARVIAEEAGYSDSSGVVEHPFYPDPSQRVLALLFYKKGDASNMAQGICVVHSETLLRLAEEIGGGVVEWDTWGKFTVAPDTDGVPGAESDPQHSVSGSRFMRVDTNGPDGWARVKVYDLSHWSRQYPDAELDGRGEPAEERAQCRPTEGFLELPKKVWNICHVAMLQESIALFSFDRHPRLDPQAQGILDIWNFW